MDKTNPDSWFEHEFTPYSSVADYANEPPRGMTNQPMNLALRKVLCKDLVEYGTELEVPYWGTAFHKSYAGAVIAGSMPNSPSQSMTLTFPRQRLARGAQSRSRLLQSYSENLRSGRILQKGTIFSRSAPDFSVVSAEENTPIHPPWHGYHPFPNTLRPIDRRGPTSLESPSKSVAAAVTEKEKNKSVRFADSPSTKSLEHHLASKVQGSPQNTEFIKTPSHDKAIQKGMRMSLHDPSSKRPSSEPPGMAKKNKDSGKDGPKDEDDNKEPKHVIDQTELDNRMRSMRGMSQLHRAAVRDRFSFGASAAPGDPMVLGASPLSVANPGSWSSDAAALTKFHNSSIRIVNPSGLQVNKEVKSKRKKKKKPEDEDELKAEAGSVFVARYPLDDGLLKMRRLRRQAFPEEERVVAPHPKIAHQEKQVKVAKELKEDLPGDLLSRVRESKEDHKEQEEALAASGYT